MHVDDLGKDREEPGPEAMMAVAEATSWIPTRRRKTWSVLSELAAKVIDS
jgi:hypothetical protein